jgi:hypothetical protein
MGLCTISDCHLLFFIFWFLVWLAPEAGTSEESVDFYQSARLHIQRQSVIFRSTQSPYTQLIRREWSRLFWKRTMLTNISLRGVKIGVALIIIVNVVSENGLLKKKFGPKRREVTERR